MMPIFSIPTVVSGGSCFLHLSVVLIVVRVQLPRMMNLLDRTILTDQRATATVSMYRDIGPVRK